MLPSKRIDLYGWDLIKTEFLNYKRYKGRGIFFRDKDQGSRNILTIRVHQRFYESSSSCEVVTVKSFYFFGQGPFIQFWRSEKDKPVSAEEGSDLNDNKWQGDFHKIIKISDQWLRLEEGEEFKVHKIEESSQGRARRVTIKIIEKNKAVRFVAFPN